MDPVMKKLSPKYQEFTKIAEGGFAEVYIALDGKQKIEVAIKIMPLNNKLFTNLYKNEIKIYKKLRHQNICTLKSSKVVEIDKKRFGVYVTEKMETDLLHYILDRGQLSEVSSKYLFREICKGVAYLHSSGVAHLDLKPDNILLQLTKKKRIDTVKICDFGFSRKWNPKKPSSSIITPDDMTANIGTIEYAAPEVRNVSAKTGNISIEKADIYSLGVMLFCMLLGQFPFVFEKGRMVSKMNLGIVQQVTENGDCYYLVKRLLSENYNDRPTIAEILADPWLSDK